MPDFSQQNFRNETQESEAEIIKAAKQTPACFQLIYDR
jgi:hypothetical protein